MKEFKCKDAGFSCDYKARGQNDEEVMRQAKEHGQQAHGMKDVKDDKIKPLIHDVA